MLDRRSLLVAGASSLASIMLPRVPGSKNAFLLPFAPTEAYADEKDPFRVLVLSRTMFGVVVVDVANKNMPVKGAQVTLASRYAAGKQLSATTAPTRPLSDGEPYFRQLTFDEWDIQYAEATFMALPKDDTANEQPDRTPSLYRLICRRVGRQRCASTK